MTATMKQALEMAQEACVTILTDENGKYKYYSPFAENDKTIYKNVYQVKTKDDQVHSFKNLAILCTWLENECYQQMMKKAEEYKKAQQQEEAATESPSIQRARSFVATRKAEREAAKQAQEEARQAKRAELEQELIKAGLRKPASEPATVVGVTFSPEEQNACAEYLAEDDRATCQICGRDIKANTGLIAHHGYKRPGYGWQTASCPGAKYLPYEQSCDRLKEIIEDVKNFIARQEKAQADFLANPPATITVYDRLYGGRQGKEIVYTKPENFNKDKYYAYKFDTYEHAYDSRKYEYQQTIKAAKTDLAIMQRRLDEWKAPAEIPFC